MFYGLSMGEIQNKRTRECKFATIDEARVCLKSDTPLLLVLKSKSH